MLTTHRNIRTHDDSTFHSDVKAVLSDVDAILAALELEHNQSNLHNTTTNPSTDVTRVGGGYVYNQTLLQSKPPREPLVLPRHRSPQRQIVSSFSNSPRQSHSTTTAAHHNTPNGLLTTPAPGRLSSKDHLGQNTVSSLSKVDFIKEFCAGGGNTPCSSPLRISPSHHRSPPKKRHQTTNDLLGKMDQITQECNETVSTIDQIQQQQQEVYHQQQEKDTRLIQQREQRDQEQRLKAEQGRAAQQKERLDKKASWIKRAWIKRAKDKLLLPSTKTVIKAVSMSTIVPKKPPRHHANKKKNAKSFEDILKEITREGVVYGAPPSPRDQIMRHTGLTPRRSATPPSALKFGRKGFTSSVSSDDSDVLSGTSDDSGDEDDQFTEGDKDMMARKLPTKKSGIRRYRSTAVSSDMWADDEVIELTSDTDMTELF